MTEKDIYTTRKAIYDDIAALEKYGFEIQRAEGKYEYFYQNDTFELAELKLMIDILRASKFVSEKKTNDLVRRLKGFCSRYQAERLDRYILTSGRTKNINESILYNVDALHAAISSDHQIGFQYVDYNTDDGSKHYRRKGEAYIRSPYHLIYADDQYYLLAYNPEENRIEHYRVDRMEGVIPLMDRPRDGGKAIAKFDLSQYTKYTFAMFSHGAGTVFTTMRFTNNLRSVVRDRFGDVFLTPEGDRHFTISVPIAVSIQFFGWVLGFGTQVKILRPANVVRQMCRYLKTLNSFYEK